MKNKLIRSIAMVLLVCVFTGLLPSCKKEEPEVEEIQVETVPIIANKKSEYVIVHGASDELGKIIANDLCSLLYKTCGVSLAIRSDSTQYEHEILVGNTNRSASNAAVERMNGDTDFLIGYLDESVVIYANSVSAMKRMMIILRDKFLNNEAQTFEIPKDDGYLYSEHWGDKDALGSVANLLQNGKTN